MPNNAYDYRIPCVKTSSRNILHYYTMFQYAWNRRAAITSGANYPFIYGLYDSHCTIVNANWYNYMSNNTFPPDFTEIYSANRLCRSDIDCVTNNGQFNYGLNNLFYASGGFRFTINLTNEIGSQFEYIDKFYFFIEFDDLPFGYMLEDITDYDAYFYYDEPYEIPYCHVFIDAVLWGSTGAMHSNSIQFQFPFDKSRKDWPMRVLMFFTPRRMPNNYIDIPCMCNGGNAYSGNTQNMRFHKCYIKFNRYMINGRGGSNFRDMNQIDQGYACLFNVYKDETGSGGNIGWYDLTLGRSGVL